MGEKLHEEGQFCRNKHLPGPCRTSFGKVEQKVVLNAILVATKGDVKPNTCRCKEKGPVSSQCAESTREEEMADALPMTR